MGREPEQAFFQRRQTDGQQAYEKMLNITNHQGNANQNNEISPHTCQNGYYQKTTNNKYWQGYGEKETLAHYWQECKLVQPLWKTVWRALRKINMELSYNPEISLLNIYIKKTETAN